MATSQLSNSINGPAQNEKDPAAVDTSLTDDSTDSSQTLTNPNTSSQASSSKSTKKTTSTKTPAKRGRKLGSKNTTKIAEKSKSKVWDCFVNTGKSKWTWPEDYKLIVLTHLHRSHWGKVLTELQSKHLATHATQLTLFDVDSILSPNQRVLCLEIYQSLLLRHQLEKLVKKR